MKKCYLLAFIICFLPLSFVFSQEELQLSQTPTASVSTELITPLNVQPLPIQSIIAKKEFPIEKPTKNIIVMITSGITGATNELFTAVSEVTRKELDRFDNAQLISPIWSSSLAKSRNNLLSNLLRIGRPVGFISDDNFRSSGFLQGARERATVKVEGFHLALSYSKEADLNERKKIVAGASADPELAAFSIKELEQQFAAKQKPIFACLYSNFADNASSINIDQLINETISNMLRRPEGYFFLIDFNGVANSRKNGNYSEMYAQLKIQQKIIRQMQTFVSSTPQTVFIVLDSQENGNWLFDEDFQMNKLASDLKTFEKVLSKIDSDNENFPLLLKNIEIADIEKEQLVSSYKNDTRALFISTAWNMIFKKHKIKFSPFSTDNELGSFLLMAIGENSKAFSRLSSYDDFMQRLLAVSGVK